jgi:uncharacterized membrane protein
VRKVSPTTDLMRRSSVHKATLLSLGAISLLALALRVARLDFQPLWWDEGYSVFFATRDLATMLARTAIDIHPPLYYALLQVWIFLVGRSDVALRLLSVGIGVAAVPSIYALACGLFNRRVGVFAAVLLALSPLHVYYSQEVRMYGLVTLLALLSMTLQVGLLKSQPAIAGSPSGASGDESGKRLRAAVPTIAPPTSSRHGHWRQAYLWALYVLVTAAALYVEYYAAFVVAAEIAVAIYWRKTQADGVRGEPVIVSPGGQQGPSLSSQPSTALAQGILWRDAPIRR